MDKNTSNARAVAIFDKRDNLIGLEGRNGKKWSVGKASLAERLMSARQRARGFNWIEGGVMATPPTVTQGAIGMALPAGMTAMADRRLATNRAAYRVRGTGGVAFEENIGGSNYIRYASERTNTAGGLAYGKGTWEVTIPTDSRYVAFELLGSATMAYMVYVRDLVGSNSGLTAANGHNIGAANQTLLIDFGAAGDREVTLLMGSSDHGIRAYAIEDTASVFNVAQDDLRWLVKGDSLVWGSMSPPPNYVGRAMGDVMRALMGCDVVCQGIGASGYIAGNNLQNAYRQEDAAKVGADLNLVLLGVNDVGAVPIITGPALQDAVKRSISGMVDRGMSEPIIVGGPWAMNRNSVGASQAKTNLLQVEADIAAAVESLAEPRIVFLPMSTPGMATPWGGVCDPWITGEQKTNSTAGSVGNSRRVVGDDTHPSLYGALYQGRRLVNECIRTAVYRGW